MPIISLKIPSLKYMKWYMYLAPDWISQAETVHFASARLTTSIFYDDICQQPSQFLPFGHHSEDTLLTHCPHDDLIQN